MMTQKNVADQCRPNDYTRILERSKLSEQNLLYLQALTDSKHATGNLEPPLPARAKLSHQDHIQSPQQLPEILVSPAPSNDGDGGDATSDKQSEALVSHIGCTCHLKNRLTNDDCSEASSCNYQHENHSHEHPSHGRSANEYGDNDNTENASEGDSEYDSDLDDDPDRAKASHAKKMRKWKSKAKGKFERMLLDCIVDTDRIAPEYRDIFINPATINALEQVTTLSLRRPNAFSHGVLKGNKVTGAILYGPPGTGKSLLAKGMAKQSGFTMISASTADLWQKCHGDDEKVIKALFSMARKLYPSIVFIDEADALLGARKAGEKRHIRSMLNQFLMEWDGLTSGANSPFILLATNRPFDLDPAVLRRAPVQIVLDIPTAHERYGILDLLLKGENLVGITLEQLAKWTDGYTGSDLKNLCVTAATQCVNDQLRLRYKDTMERRDLTFFHFQSAMERVRATGLSKTMVNEMKKFEKNARHEDTRREDE